MSFDNKVFDLVHRGIKLLILLVIGSLYFGFFGNLGIGWLF